MKILIDTNIVLDVLLQRKRFFYDSAEILELAENKKVDAYITSSSVTDIVYILKKKSFQLDHIKEMLMEMFDIIRIVEIGSDDILSAFALDFSNFEDALQSTCASKIRADHIVSRNEKDFKNSKVPCISPNNLVKRF